MSERFQTSMQDRTLFNDAQNNIRKPSSVSTSSDQSFSLEQLFNMCDTDGNGVICLQEFLELSTKFGISEEDAYVIFTDLDHDGDGHINFDDFAYGFNDFITPGSRRGSFQVNLVDGVSATQQLMEMEKKHGAAKNAWQHFVTNVHPTDPHPQQQSSEMPNKSASSKSEPLSAIINDLRKEKGPELSTKLESALGLLISDMQSLQDEYKNLEKTFRKERETHAAQLAALGEELDNQLVKTEVKAKTEARLEAQRQMEAERKKIAMEMESKLGELTSQMRTYEKVEEWLSEEEARERRSRSDSMDSSKLIESENRSLKSALAEAQMKATVLQTQLTQKRNEYLDLYNEFHSEKMAASEYKNQCDLMQNHLSVLSHANRILSDANDCHFVNNDSLSSSMSRKSRVSLYDEVKAANDNDDETMSSHVTKELIKVTKMRKVQDGMNSPVGSGAGSIHSPDNDIDSGRETLVDEIRHDADSSPIPSGLWSVRSQSPRPQSPRTSPRPSPRNVQGSPSMSKSYETRGNHLSTAQFNKTLIQSTTSLPISYEKCESVSSSSMDLTSPIGYSQPKQHPLLLQRTFKVILAGDAAVGKTSFIERACNGHFVSRLSSTIGVDFRVKNLEYNGHNVVLQLWDTAGQERFRSLTKSYFRRADGVILIYDVTNERTFASIRHWIQNIEEGAGRKIPVILCGNKIDLREELYRGVTCVRTGDGEKLGKQCDAIFTEISPKTGHNVIETLYLLTKEMSAIEDAELLLRHTSSVQINAIDKVAKKKSCCGGLGNNNNK